MKIIFNFVKLRWRTENWRRKDNIYDTIQWRKRCRLDNIYGSPPVHAGTPLHILTSRCGHVRRQLGCTQYAECDPLIDGTAAACAAHRGQLDGLWDHLVYKHICAVLLPAVVSLPIPPAPERVQAACGSRKCPREPWWLLLVSNYCLAEHHQRADISTLWAWRGRPRTCHRPLNSAVCHFCNN